MLFATQGKSVHSTQQYFDQVLTQGDYYLGQEVRGQWRGKGAAILGLGERTEVTKDQFDQLLRGQHPITGARLTQRDRRDRRPGMDLTFSVPKSVSLAWAVNGDERIVDVLRDAVHETIKRDIEPLMQRRVRDGNRANTRQKALTQKLIYADFLHKTSRPVDGKADPHLHIHAFVMNWTEHHGKHYAGEMEEIVRQRPSLQAKFESRLARKLERELGYEVTQTRYAQTGRIKAGWEIEGVSRDTIEKFSRRTAQVEEYAKQNDVTKASEKATLGKLTREQKDTGTTLDQLRAEWRSRLTDTERDAFGELGGNEPERGEEAERERAAASVKYAIEHHLYRQSTVERHQVVGTALEHGLTLSPEQIEASLGKMDLIERSMDSEGTSRQFVTTREVLAAEREMIDFARDGRGTRKAIARDEHEFNRDWLHDHQKEAVISVLQSRDTVMAVTGGAGTGKSSLMKEASEAIEQNGKTVFTFAPSTGAKEVLQDNGFKNAQTVEHLIRNEKLHPKLEGNVLWIDEAGLLDVRSMNAVFDIAKKQNARVVLSGDTRQHSSPRRGEAMRLLENEAGLNIARVEAIQRQKGKYREVVEMISKGHVIVDEKTAKSGLLAGFDRLDAMGKIQEIGDGERQERLAEKYLESELGGKTTLVVAPTHSEAKSVTQHIRNSLRETGKLAEEERPLLQLRSLNLTEAEKGEAMTYSDQSGSVVQFHQNAKGGFKKGDRYRVAGAVGNDVQLVSMDSGMVKSLPLTACDRFEVYAEKEIKLAAGDKVRFSLGGTAKDGNKRISNGRLDEVTGFDKSGNIILKRGTVVDKNFGHLDLGYVITSHASQGKDRSIALAAMSSESLPAVNAKQFYVTVSRGSEDVMLYVDDKARIRRAIEKSGDQLSATELIRSSEEERSCDNTATQQYDYWRQGQNAIKSFRDRLSHWWNSKTSEQANQYPVGRHRRADPARRLGHDIAQSFGLTPDLGRSR